MIMKIAVVSMEQEFELNSLEDNSLKREMESHHMSENLSCCGGNDQRSVSVNIMEQHLQQQQQGAGVLPYPVEMLCPPVGSLPGGGRRTVVLAGSTPGFTPDYHHPNFPPSSPSVAAVPADSPAMQPDGRTNLLDESMQMWLTAGPQPLDLRSDMNDVDSWINRRVYGDILSTTQGMDDHQSQAVNSVMQQHLQQQQQQQKLCINGYGSVESVPPPSSSSGSFSASDDCESLGDMPSPSFNSNGNSRNMMRLDPSTEMDGGLDDNQLIALSVRDLNRKLHGYPRELIQKIKQKRRTLKNRGYAQNCRTKRIAQKCELERNNDKLTRELQRLMQQREIDRQEKERAFQERDRALQERDFFKQQLKQLALRSRECSQAGSLSTSLSSTNANSPNSPEFYI